ncbi:hypothetical protein Pst134EA_027766 [Puccinia striiformis f. sp. tritici]|uniref:hypothetical protein n=1 Tax=Puccinia striiformis f. sp. tritici TaxID=168172 RepID=UPI002008B3EC|nr:hypothetical protein Pst134EA_027766 [Puccinia striiformis f. sp. tritici]KAH9448456.1 hypothetical protein Pst134EA_027766 [Puccinia striiformis f. sp. tritici]
MIACDGGAAVIILDGPNTKTRSSSQSDQDGNHRVKRPNDGLATALGLVNPLSEPRTTPKAFLNIYPIHRHIADGTLTNSQTHAFQAKQGHR